jgi:hypothetical protein
VPGDFKANLTAILEAEDARRKIRQREFVAVELTNRNETCDRKSQIIGKLLAKFAQE